MDVCEEAEEAIEVQKGPSEKNNGVARRPRIREIASRYKAASTPVTAPKRCPSPNLSPRSPSLPAANKRAQSAERRRPTTPSSPSRPSTPPHDVEMQISARRSMGGRSIEGLWPSMRSLSVSFQADSISVPFSKRDKPIANASADHTLRNSANLARKGVESARKVTPERKRTPLRGKNVVDQSENSKPVENSNARVVPDQHLWPGRMGGKLSGQALTRSLDLTDKYNKSTPLISSGRRVSPSKRMLVSDGMGRGGLLNSVREVAKQISRISSVDDASSRPAGSSKLVSSSGGVSSNSSEKISMKARPNRSQSSPVRESHNPPSPQKATSALPFSTRGSLSPARSRPSTPSSPTGSVSSRSSCSSSVFGFVVDVRNGKKGVSQAEDVHQLRILHNRYLQWRFVNAQADAVSSIQKLMAENILYSVWHTTSGLRDSLTMQKIDLQQLSQEMKLKSILSGQMNFLDDWSLEEREHASCLSEAIEALEASIVHLPVTGGARADIQTVKVAVSSAVDIMQAMGSYICKILSRVERMNRLVSQLASVTVQERAMIDKCGDLLASTAAMQVQESSLRTHLMQLQQAMYKREQSILSIQKLMRQPSPALYS